MNNKPGSAARRNMAYQHRYDNHYVKFTRVMDSMQEHFDARLRELQEAKLLMPRKAEPRMSYGISPMFGIKLTDPMKIAGISSIETGRVRSDERLMAVPKEQATRRVVRNATEAIETRMFDFENPEAVAKMVEESVAERKAFYYKVPPLFAPRDNGHRQSADDLEKLEKLIAESTYVPPPHTRDRFERPAWGPDVNLKDGRHPDAGEWGKLCFRTACQRPHAFFYNSGTYKHYCQKCADGIDRENMGGFKLHHLAEFEGQPAKG